MKDSGFNWTWAFIGPWHETSRLGPSIESSCQTQTGHGTLNFCLAQTKAHVGVAEVFAFTTWVSKSKELYDNNIDALIREYWIVQTWSRGPQRCKKSYLWRLRWRKAMAQISLQPRWYMHMVWIDHTKTISTYDHQNYYYATLTKNLNYF